MSLADSALDTDALDRARALLARPEHPERLWPTLAAAAFAAVAALTLATAMIMAPPVTTTHLPISSDPSPLAGEGGPEGVG